MTPTGPLPRPRYPLGLKLALAAIALAVLPLLGVGLALIDVNARAMKDAIREFQVAVADDIARTLSERLAAGRAGPAPTVSHGRAA